MERTEIIRVSYRVLDYARAAFREQIQSLLDDPSDLISPWREAEPAEVIASMRSLGEELSLDYDTLLLEGHKFQRERLAGIEAGTIKPAPRDPSPARAHR